MDLGFETIGNATLICHDRGPVLATDPWLEGGAYFGSWGLSHQIPERQLANVRDCKFLWISHGHPDHLSLPSLEKLRDKQILLPDHYGGRIHKGLEDLGYRVRVLSDGVWTQLSDRMRVCCIGDYYQDAILLVDLGGRLIIDSNDASDRGAGGHVIDLVRKYDTSFLLAMTGYGDADMINFFDEAGVRVRPPAMDKMPFGQGIAGILHDLGVDYYVPFASMHRYQRTDSAWANHCTTPPGAHYLGFESERSEILPAFVRYDLIADQCDPIDPPLSPETLYEPGDFGDDWHEELHPGDHEKLQAYFEPISHLQRFLGYVNFRVGGRDHEVDINRAEFDRGITFEAPRTSLMAAVENRTFDDLLIGNFTRTTLHGEWERTGSDALYPDFTPFLKYADNANARSPAELRDYFDEYVCRGYFGVPNDETGLREAGAILNYLGHSSTAIAQPTRSRVAGTTP